jgi:hypothetical protein
MGARVYIPKVGRFIQVDPVDGGAANAYDYALQDPLDNLDLDGRGVVGVVKAGLKSVISIGKDGWRFAGSKLLGYGSAVYCGFRAADTSSRTNVGIKTIHRFKGFYYFLVDAYDCYVPRPIQVNKQ